MDEIQAEKPIPHDTGIQDRPVDDENSSPLAQAGGSGWVTAELLVTAGVYVLSFCLPVLSSPPGRVIYGYEVFSMVTLGLFVDLAHGRFELIPLWLPNPLFWVALQLGALRRFRAAAVMGILALMCSSLLIWGKDEVGKAALFHADLASGYYVWQASMLLLVVVSMLAALRSNATDRGSPMPPGPDAERADTEHLGDNDR